VEAVVRKLGGPNIGSELAGVCGLGQQVSNEVSELVLRSVDVFRSMDERREFGPVVVVGDERVGLEHRL
jgi:hypothetical protein